MPWTYSQSTGQLARNNRVIGTGYSGSPIGRDNPRMEAVTNVGPIPRGSYRIGPRRNTPQHGPQVMSLTPVGHNALGRDNFLIHGEKKNGVPGNASRGCIILGPSIRRRIAASGDHDLDVID
jgi:hypothetical protein